MYFTCFDFEALQAPRDEIIHGRNFIFKHVPATFSVASNIPSHRNPVHQESTNDPQKLADAFIEILQQERVNAETRNKFVHVFEALDRELTRLETLTRKVKENRQKKKTPLRVSLDLYCNQLIVLSFNGQKYDIPLIKRYILYMALSTPRLKFIDVINYLAA